MSKNIKQRLLQAIASLLGEDKKIFSKRDVEILNIALFGEVPTDVELNIFFKKIEQEEASLQDILSYFRNKAIYHQDSELHILEMFRAIDTDTKCFISLKDILEAYEKTGIKFRREVLVECFNTISGDENILDFFTFKSLYEKNKSI